MKDVRELLGHNTLRRAELEEEYANPESRKRATRDDCRFVGRQKTKVGTKNSSGDTWSDGGKQLILDFYKLRKMLYLNKSREILICYS
jgi:hypothetical protein